MSEYWFNNIFILFKNLNEFYPKHNLNKIHKINAIARLGIYYSIILIIFKLDTKYIAISVCLLIISFFLGITEQLENTTIKCTEPTTNNPFMNFLFGDNSTKLPACKIDDIRTEEINNYRINILPEVSDLYGKTITDRNFYTMPSTTIVNDQESFLNFLYGDFGRCKSEGKDCLKHRNNIFHRGRYYKNY